MSMRVSWIKNLMGGCQETQKEEHSDTNKDVITEDAMHSIR